MGIVGRQAALCFGELYDALSDGADGVYFGFRIVASHRKTNLEAVSGGGLRKAFLSICRVLLKKMAGNDTIVKRNDAGKTAGQRRLLLGGLKWNRSEHSIFMEFAIRTGIIW